MEKSDKPGDNNNNSNKEKTKSKGQSKKAAAPTTPNPQAKRGSGSTREVIQLSVESTIPGGGSQSGNPNNSFVSSTNKPPITKRGDNSSKKFAESGSTKGSVRRASKLASNSKNEALIASSKKLSSNDNFESNNDTQQETNSVASEIRKNSGIGQGHKQSASQNNLNSKTIANDIQDTSEPITGHGKSPSKKIKHSQKRLNENASKLSDKKLLKNPQTGKKIQGIGGSKDKRNSGVDLKSLDLKAQQRSNSQVNDRSLVSPQGSQKRGSRQGSNNSRQLSSKKTQQEIGRNAREPARANPPLLSEEDNASFNDADVNVIQPNEENLSTLKDNTAAGATASSRMVLKVPSDSVQLTSKKNSNREEQVIDDKSEDDNEDDDPGDDEVDSPSQEQRDSKTNIAEQFRLAMQQEHMKNNPMILGSGFIPPPEDLIKKTVVDDEPVKTGAPIAFLKFNRLYGRERQEKMNPDNKNRSGPDGDGQGGAAGSNAPGYLEIAPATTISDYMINAKEANRIVYCRFGEKYITDLEKRRNSNISSLNAPTMSSASYLINIKKLVEEHNIEGEKRDFKSMRSGQMGKTIQMPPQQFYQLTGPEDKTLVFESRFESGNLLTAIKVSDEEYDLVLQNDINTNGNTQWYFFRCTNTHAGQKIRFNMLNLAKPDSLYNYGMKVLCFSNKIKDGEGVGWHRIGENINYYQNQYKRDQCRFFRTYYSFTFTHTFEHTDDSCFFAHCFPYTYSDLQDDLSKIEKDTDCTNFYNKGMLTRTLAGNRCDYLTITSKDKDPKSAKAMAKKGVFISARVHPGESNASWMMKGVIEFLVSNTPEAKALRDHFVFKIVPILNPDGVINGNYRCSLAGQDLNRRWKAPSKILHPVNSAVKKLIRSFVKEREIILYCDLHGHSRRKNIFMYGNNIKEQPHASRVFPYIMSKLCDYFSFEQSRFSMSRAKDGTARIAMFKELGIANIFTMEASFCGPDKGKSKDLHFTTEALMMAGQRLLESLIVYCKIEIKQNINQIKTKKEDDEPSYNNLNAEALQKELTANTKLIKMTMGDEAGSSGSDSEPSADNLEEDEMAKIVPIKKKPAPPKDAKKPVPPVKKPVAVIKKPQSPQEKKRPPNLKEFSKSPTKRPFGYKNAFDRMRRKPEMKDAWTQTTPKSKEQLEKERREHKQRKNANYLLLQQQQQQMMMQKYQQQLNQQNKGQYPNFNSSAGNEPQNMVGTLGDIAARNHQRQTDLRNQAKLNHQIGNSLNSINVNQTHPGKSQVNSSFNLNPLLLSQNQFQNNQNVKNANNQGQIETASSPQPQIRIRTDPFKNKPSNDLTKFEQRLVHKHQDGTIITGPQHGSVAHNMNHRGSNKRLPQIQSSNSQRKEIGQKESNEYHHIQRVKTLNQQQFNSFGNYNQDGKHQQIVVPQSSNQVNKTMSQTVHQRQVSGQSPTNQQKHQNLINTQYAQQMVASPQPNMSQNNGRRLVHAPNQYSQQQQQPQLNEFVNVSNRPYTDKKPIQSQQNQRQHYHLSVSPNKMNRIPLNNLAGSVALSGHNQSGPTAQHLQMDFQQAGFSSALASLNQQVAPPQTIHNYREATSGAQTHGQNSITTFQTQGKVNQQNGNAQMISSQGGWQNQTIQQMNQGKAGLAVNSPVKQSEPSIKNLK